MNAPTYWQPPRRGTQSLFSPPPPPPSEQGVVSALTYWEPPAPRRGPQSLFSPSSRNLKPNGPSVHKELGCGDDWGGPDGRPTPPPSRLGREESQPHYTHDVTARTMSCCHGHSMKSTMRMRATKIQHGVSTVSTHINSACS